MINLNTQVNTQQSKQLTNWSQSVGDYIKQRRVQTRHAYANLHTNPYGNLSNNVNNAPQNTTNQLQTVQQEQEEQNENLFQAMLIILGQELSEGHTVFELLDLQNESWQTQLLFKLLQPWQTLVNLDDVDGDDRSNNKSNDELASQNSTPKPYQPKSYQQRFVELCLSSQAELLLGTAQLDTNSKALLYSRQQLATQVANQFANNIKQMSLADFAQVLSANPLFAQATKVSKISKVKSVSNAVESKMQPIDNPAINSPIVYQQQVESTVWQATNSKQQALQTQGLETQAHQSLVFWLHRSWFAEFSIAQNIKRINDNTPPPLAIDAYLSDTLNAGQKQAITTANNSAFSIITGGPGTGKTYTVAQLVMALHQAHTAKQLADSKAQANSNQKKTNQVNSKQKNNGDIASKPLSLALSAPTGKAAQRMQESLQASINQSGINIELQQAKTIHRLLGIGVTGLPRYHADNPLSEDIIIVDEASMLGVELANHLLSAVKSGARLILLGDAYQLAAVDAGSVLADLCKLPALANNHQTLTESKRFDSGSGVGKLATLINQPLAVCNEQNVNNQNSNQQNDGCENASIAEQQTHRMMHLNELFATEPTLNFYQLTANQSGKKQNALDLSLIEEAYQPYFEQTKTMLTMFNKLNKLNMINDSDHVPPTNNANSEQQINTQANTLMQTFNNFRILTAGHQGSLGDIELNQRLANKHKTILKQPLSSSNWYHGRPIMITKNNYQLGLYNGDIGLCLQTAKGFMLFFEHKSAFVPVNMLNEGDITTAYAMTVHKSQGSEFAHVAIMLGASERLLSRELIYTAVTRAKQQVSIYSTPSALQTAILTPTVRQTGLGLQC